LRIVVSLSVDFCLSPVVAVIGVCRILSSLEVPTIARFVFPHLFLFTPLDALADAISDAEAATDDTDRGNNPGNYSTDLVGSVLGFFVFSLLKQLCLHVLDKPLPLLFAGRRRWHLTAKLTIDLLDVNAFLPCLACALNVDGTFLQTDATDAT